MSKELVDLKFRGFVNWLKSNPDEDYLRELFDECLDDIEYLEDEDFFGTEGLDRWAERSS